MNCCVATYISRNASITTERNMEAIPRKFTPEELVQLTAAERRQLGTEFDARKAAAEMSLRQWCVEQAIRVVDNIKIPESPHGQSTTTNINIDVVSIARGILDFVSAPFKPVDSK